MAYPPTSIGSPPRPLPRASAWVARLLSALALAAALPGLAQVNAPLPVDKAFRLSARALNPETIEARFVIADGYYLYRDRINFSIEPAAARLAVPPLPEGKVKEDQFFGKVQTYRGGLIVNLAVRDAKVGERVVLKVESQGCADVGICYPPNTQRISLVLPAANSAPTRPDEPAKKSWFN